MSQIHKHKSNDVFSRDIGKIGIDIKGIKPGVRIVKNKLIIDFGKYFFAFSGMHFNPISDLPQNIDMDTIKKYLQGNKLFHCVIVKDGFVVWNATTIDINYVLVGKRMVQRHKLTHEGKAILKTITSTGEKHD